MIIPSKSPYNVRISDDSYVPGLTEVVKAIREVSSETKIGIQIMQFLKLSRSGWRQTVEDFTSTSEERHSTEAGLKFGSGKQPVHPE